MNMVGIRFADWTITPEMDPKRVRLCSGEGFCDYLREMLQANPQRVFSISFRGVNPCGSSFCHRSLGRLTREELGRFSIFPQEDIAAYSFLIRYYPEIQVLPKDFKEESIPWINPFPKEE